MDELSDLLSELEHLANCPSWCRDSHLGELCGAEHLTPLVDLDTIEGMVRVFGQHGTELGRNVAISADGVMTPDQARRLATELLRLADLVHQP